MAIVFPMKEKTITYSFLEQGLHISEDQATGWLYLCLGVALWLTIGWTLPALNLWIALIIAIPLTIIILAFGVLRLKAVQKLLHKETLVPWDTVIKATMNKTQIRFTFKEGTYTTGNGMLKIYDHVEFSIRKGSESDIHRFLSTTLSDRFLVI